jgi:hypothetical protein
MSDKDAFEFAATTIGVTLLMLRGKGHTDSEIVKMFGRDKVKAMLNVLNGKEEQSCKS